TLTLALFSQNNNQAVLSRGLLTSLDTTNPNDHGEAIFENPKNHASAVASILVYSANQAGFRPRERGILDRTETFENYIRKAIDFPGFTKAYTEYEPLELTGDVQQFEQEVIKKYSSNINKKEEIARALTGLLNSLNKVDLGTKKKFQSQKDWLLTLTVINKPVNYYVTVTDVINVSLSLLMDTKTNTFRLNRQHATLVVVRFATNPEFLNQFAKQISSKIPTVKVQEALTTLSTGGLKNYNYVCSSINNNDNNGNDSNGWKIQGPESLTGTWD
ncbi:hypothetical protein BX616_002635, partial [Lobosporangium transversale]